jgi:choline dehydrogenase-like flavoprotein
MTDVLDAVIVGSGATGAWAAKDLTAAGLRVMVLEAGPSRATMRARDLASRVRRRLGYPIDEDVFAIARQRIQSSNYAWSGHPAAFVDDVDNPYVAPDDRPFHWIRGRQIGGRMAIRGHGRQFYRMSDEDFGAPERDGQGARWPFTYADLVPHYERVERFFAIAGSRENLPGLPDSLFAERASLEGAALRIATAIEAKMPGRRVIPARRCVVSDALAVAAETKRLTVRSDAMVRSIRYDPSSGRAHGVSFVDTRTGLPHEVRADAVILCASAIESARILLNSATREHPAGLGNASGVLGRYLMDHPRLGPFEGRIAGLRGPEEPFFMHVPRFVDGARDGLGFFRGYSAQLYLLGDRLEIIAVGEMLPRPDNRVTIDPVVVDRWGIPAVRIECAFGDNERAMAEHARRECTAMLQAAGCELLGAPEDLSPPGTAIHEVGTARMGSDRATSFLDPFNRSWEVENLFVLDGASWVSQGVQNPTLTMLAIASRACARLVATIRSRS